MKKKIGKFIGVGSVKHGQGITSLVYNLGYNLSRDPNINILIFDINFLFGEIEFLAGQKVQSSIDDLISAAKNQTFNSDMLIQSVETLKPNLKIINPSQINSTDYLKNNAEYVIEIIQVGLEKFDIVIVDTVAGAQNPVSRLVHSSSDLFINVMTQNPYILEWYKTYNLQKNIKELNVINMFEPDIYPNSTEIVREYGIDHIVLNYSKQMRNYYNRRDIDTFVDIKDPYNDCIKILVDKISSILGVNLNQEKNRNFSEGTRRGFFSNLFKKN